MVDGNEEIAAAAERIHEEIPHQFQVSLTMSMDTREQLRAIREEVNDKAGKQIFDTDDAMRVALLAAAHYHAIATDDAATNELDEERLLPLTAVIWDILEDDAAAEVLETDSS